MAHLISHPAGSAVEPRRDASGPNPEARSAEAVAQLRAALGVPDPDLLAALEPDVETRLLPAGAVLFREGDPSDAMYVVLRGELEVTVGHAQHGEMVVGRVEAGELAGEMQILSGGTRTATVRAAGEVEIARIPRAAVEHLVRDVPAAMGQLTAAIHRRIRRNQLAAILPPLFGALDESILRGIEECATWLTLPRGATLFAQGESGNRAFLLVTGRLHLRIPLRQFGLLDFHAAPEIIATGRDVARVEVAAWCAKAAERVPG